MSTQLDKITDKISSTVATRLDKVKNYLAGKQDVISVIKEDHKPLKELIQIMKDGEKSVTERAKAFSEFAPLLLTHAKAEEESLYESMRTIDSLKEEAFENDAEHSVADQLVEEISRTTNKDDLGAKIKVLAELVEHHIKEEEQETFPRVEEIISNDKLVELTKKYVEVQTEIIAAGQTDSPSEANLSREDLAH